MQLPEGPPSPGDCQFTLLRCLPSAYCSGAVSLPVFIRFLVRAQITAVRCRSAQSEKPETAKQRQARHDREIAHWFAFQAALRKRFACVPLGFCFQSRFAFVCRAGLRVRARLTARSTPSSASTRRNRLQRCNHSLRVRSLANSAANAISAQRAAARTTRFACN